MDLRQWLCWGWEGPGCLGALGGSEAGAIIKHRAQRFLSAEAPLVAGMDRPLARGLSRFPRNSPRRQHSGGLLPPPLLGWAAGRQDATLIISAHKQDHMAGLKQLRQPRVHGHRADLPQQSSHALHFSGRRQRAWGEEPRPPTADLWGQAPWPLFCSPPLGELLLPSEPRFPQTEAGKVRHNALGARLARVTLGCLGETCVP